MDPLSITASCLAVLGALTTSSKGVKKLIDLQHAGDEFLELRNEAESLRGVIGLFREALLEIHDTSAYRDNRELLSALLESAHRTVLDLQAVIEYRYVKLGEDEALYLSGKSGIRCVLDLREPPLDRRFTEILPSVILAYSAVRPLLWSPSLPTCRGLIMFTP